MPQARVLFLDHTAKLGGGEIALFNLLTHLDRQRFSPQVILFSDGPLREKLAAADIPVCVLQLDSRLADARKDSLGGRSSLKIRTWWEACRFVWRLSKMIRQERADIVHTNSLKSDVLGGFAARLARVPVVWHIRDRITDDYLPLVVVRVFRLLCRIVPVRLVANSSATLSTLGKKLFERGAVVHSGYDNSNVNVIHDGTLIHMKDKLIGEVFVPVVTPVVGLVGRLTRWKGQHIFLSAAAVVKQQFPEAQFQLIGSALFGEQAYEQELRAQCAALHLKDSVEFLGFRTDVNQLIQNLDVLVHASITGEPFGQVIIEGMAASKPVVATRGGGVPEIVVDGETGLLVPMNDAPALAAAICRVLEDPYLAAAMGRAGQQRVLERFLVEHTALGMMHVFDDVIRMRGKKHWWRGKGPPPGASSATKSAALPSSVPLN